jgi:hypothetical protein
LLGGTAPRIFALRLTPFPYSARVTVQKHLLAMSTTGFGSHQWLDQTRFQAASTKFQMGRDGWYKSG